MASKIRVLSDHTINKIAAGEVIENPASVVKELVENAIDAGATEICIEIQLGGRQLIRITDNGCGMQPDDALLCLERHATSKIKEVEDILSVLTMGFRGEALPSVAAVSKFSILTCPQEETQGTFILVEGGSILSCKPAVRSPGTTIEVKSLFFNVPVRRKFQRSPSYDVQEVLKMVTTLAMGHPSIHFELISDQQRLFKTVVNSAQTFKEQLLSKIETLHGGETTRMLTPLAFECPPFKIEGFIGTPALHKPNKTGQYLYINKRAVQAPLVSVAVREGYGTLLGNHRYPVFYLHVEIPGPLLDVNVHPQKKEVRLREGSKLKEALIQAVQQALQKEGALLNQMDKVDFTQDFYPRFEIPAYTVNEEKWEYQSNPPPSLPVIQRRETAEQASPLPLHFPALPRILASIPNYLIIDASTLPQEAPFSGQVRDGLCLMDQQAAYARICFEKMLDLEEKSVAMLTLLIPAALQFTPTEALALRENLTLIEKMGFSIREAGNNTFLVEALPPYCSQEKAEEILQNLLEDLLSHQASRTAEQEREKQLAQSACKATLPKNKRLNLDEGQGLIKELMKCRLIYRCPRGRAIFSCLSQETLSKYFQI